MNWDDLMFENFAKYTPGIAYRQSKLANILFTRELAKRLSGTDVTVNALHPGLVKSMSQHFNFGAEFFSNYFILAEIARSQIDKYGILYKIAIFLMKPFLWLVLKTVEQGAQTTIYLAVSEQVDGISGRFFSDCKERKLLAHATNDEDASRLWQISEEYVKNYL